MAFIARVGIGVESHGGRVSWGLTLWGERSGACDCGRAVGEGRAGAGRAWRAYWSIEADLVVTTNSHMKPWKLLAVGYLPVTSPDNGFLLLITRSLLQHLCTSKPTVTQLLAPGPQILSLQHLCTSKPTVSQLLAPGPQILSLQHLSTSKPTVSQLLAPGPQIQSLQNVVGCPRTLPDKSEV